MVAKAVSSETALNAAKKPSHFKTVALALFLGAVFMPSGMLLYGLIRRIVASFSYLRWQYILNPKEYWRRYPLENWYALERAYTEQNCDEEFEMLYKLQSGSNALENATAENMQRCFNTAPLSLGNAVAIRDYHSVIFNSTTRALYVAFLFLEQWTIALFLIWAIGALLGMHEKLDLETFAALKAFVDMVIVIALVEIAISFKKLLWGFGCHGRLHEHDRRVGDP